MKIHGAANYCHLIVTLKWQFNLLVLRIKTDLVDLYKETWARKSLELSRKCWLPIIIYRITHNWLIITIKGIKSCCSRLSMEKARVTIQTILIWKISSRKNLKNWKRNSKKIYSMMLLTQIAKYLNLRITLRKLKWWIQSCLRIHMLDWIPWLKRLSLVMISHIKERLKLKYSNLDNF